LLLIFPFNQDRNVEKSSNWDERQTNVQKLGKNQKRDVREGSNAGDTQKAKNLQTAPPKNGKTTGKIKKGRFGTAKEEERATGKSKKRRKKIDYGLDHAQANPAPKCEKLCTGNEEEGVGKLKEDVKAGISAKEIRFTKKTS